MFCKNDSKTYRAFIAGIILVILLVLSVLFLGMAIRTRELISEANIHQARSLFNAIVMTRKWNASYGGVYVLKKKGVESNPYLDNPDFTADDGKIYTKRNPALMTREISRIAEEKGFFQFTITSLKPLNPQNIPDDFERTALQLFEKGQKEYITTEEKAGKQLFRFMAPLTVEKDCLQCHAKQGYKTGDIRGGISVSFNIDKLNEELRLNTALIAVAGISTALFFLSFIYFSTLRLMMRIRETRKQNEILAVTDELTSLYNRRYVVRRFDQEFSRVKRSGGKLSCIIIDIDRFKSINDKYGHVSGDRVLKKTAYQIRSSVRTYDIAGRYGGEEFIVVLPDCDSEGAFVLAERIRTSVKETIVDNITVTVSCGLSCFKSDDETMDDIMRRADDALSTAKDSGRDRSEILL